MRPTNVHRCLPALLFTAILAILTTTQAWQPVIPTCQRTLWLSGLQLQSKTGPAQYITDSTSYMNSYLVALQSARLHAPSLLPVLVVQGPVDELFAARVKALGGQIVQHTLSFLDTLQYHQPTLASGLYGSYLRVDVPAIMQKVRALRALSTKEGPSGAPGSSPLDIAGANLDYVLWTDPDVVLLGDIDDCTLPKPRYLAIGPDASHFNADNCGVVHYNVSGFAEVQSDMIAWAAFEKNFRFLVADQDMIKGYFALDAQANGKSSKLQLLPDTYNWKPYWGKPFSNSHWTKPAAIKILHTHGPKLKLVQCVMDKFKSRSIGQWDARYWVMEDANTAWMAEQCSCESRVVRCRSLFGLIGQAYAADLGEYYNEVQGLISNHTKQVQHLLQQARLF